MSDRWDDLRFNAAEGEWAARPLGDMRRCLADLLAERDALAAEVARLRAAIKTVDDQRRYAERCVGSLPLKMGEHFERRKAEMDAFVAALTEGDDRG